MNKLFLIVLVFLSIQVYSQVDENVLIKYKVHKINNINLNKQLSDVIKQDNNTMDYELYFNGKEGKFIPVYKLNNSQTKQINLNDIFKKNSRRILF